MSAKWQSRQLQALISPQTHQKPSRKCQNQFYQNSAKQSTAYSNQANAESRKKMQLQICRKVLRWFFLPLVQPLSSYAVILKQKPRTFLEGHPGPWIREEENRYYLPIIVCVCSNLSGGGIWKTDTSCSISVSINLEVSTGEQVRKVTGIVQKHYKAY